MQSHLLTYSQRDSPIHRMDARWKLAALALAIAATVGLQTAPSAAWALFSAIAMMAFARLPARWFFARLLGAAAILGFFLILLPLTMPERNIAWGPIRLSESGLQLALVILLKALTVVALTLLLLGTTPFDTLLKAAHALWIPGLLIHMAMLTYRYIFLFWDELGKLRIALRVRGYRNRMATYCYRTIGHVTGTLLVRSYERAERVGQAMRCRGFDGRFRALHSFATTAGDPLLFMIIVLSAVAAPLAVEYQVWTMVP